MEIPKPEMEYQKMGPSGLKVSRLSFGNMNFEDEKKEDIYFEIVKKCFELGINYIDTAECYGTNLAETLLGRILKKINKRRDEYVISTKLFFNRGFMNFHPVNTAGLSRKHIIEGTYASLKRLQLDYVDVLFCHRPDPDVPMEEVCRAMNFVIDHGYSFYWGTSEWSAYEIMEAYKICDRLNLARPIVEQPQYNMLVRDRFENEYAPLFENFHMGTTIYSPLAGGFLTGKYLKEIPKNTRNENPMYKSFFYDPFMRPDNKEKNIGILKALAGVAEAMKCSMAQLAIGWAVKNPDVTTAIFGPSSVKQLEENIVGLKISKLITPQIEEQIEKILKNKPERPMSWVNFKPLPSRR